MVDYVKDKTSTIMLAIRSFKQKFKHIKKANFNSFKIAWKTVWYNL